MPLSYEDKLAARDAYLRGEKDQWDAGRLEARDNNPYRPGDVIGGFVNRITGTDANNAYNAAEAEKNRVFNATEAQKARDFEERMSSTAYSRAAADMKAAGINPATLTGLSGGSVASTPSGSAATGTSASSGSGSNVLGTILSAVIGGMFLGRRASTTQKRVSIVYRR